MGQAEYTQDALDELDGIYAYTLETWGSIQAARYIRKLNTTCRSIAQNPFLGQAANHLRPGIRRFPQGSHVIFYDVTSDGIRILRVLHKTQLPSRYLNEND